MIPLKEVHKVQECKQRYLTSPNIFPLYRKMSLSRWFVLTFSDKDRDEINLILFFFCFIVVTLWWEIIYLKLSPHQGRFTYRYATLWWKEWLRRECLLMLMNLVFSLVCLHLYQLHVTLPATSDPDFHSLCSHSFLHFVLPLFMSVSTRRTVQRRCTAGSRLCQGPLWPSGALGGQLPR